MNRPANHLTRLSAWEGESYVDVLTMLNAYMAACTCIMIADRPLAIAAALLTHARCVNAIADA